MRVPIFSSKGQRSGQADMAMGWVDPWVGLTHGLG